jgi:hypothetical protein
MVTELKVGPHKRAWAAVKQHQRSLNVLFWLLVLVFMVDVATFTAGFQSNDDTGTYTAQAWAVLFRGDLAHYTYWYDHPPVGWLQIAAFAWLTRGFQRSDIDSLMAGEFMVIMQLASCALIFMLVRRLAYNRGFAALGVVLFALSPLAIYFQKQAFLDNIAVTWTLAAMVFAASPRRSLGAALGSALCMAVATLSKETAAIWLVVVIYMICQNYPKGHRAWALSVFGSAYFIVSAFYLGYAAIKGELFPGVGHVSLWDAVVWQLNRDEAGGDTVGGWLAVDHWLLVAAALATVPAFFVRRLRPIAVGFAMLVFSVFRGGYIPAPFVIGMLPFAALLLTGLLGSLWPHSRKVAHRAARSRTFVRVVRGALVVVMLAVGSVTIAPSWAAATEQATSRAEVVYYQETLQWIRTNVPRNAVIAVDDITWDDIHDEYPNAVWFYKLDLDPEIKAKYPRIDYIAMKQLYFYIARDATGQSRISQAAQNSQLVAQFGDPGRYTAQDLTQLFVIRKVNNEEGK